MKKFFIVFVTILLACFCLFSGCKKDEGLSKYVSQLHSDVFSGKSENFSVRATYGFVEKDFNNDGKVLTRVYQLNFHLLDKQLDQQTYYVYLSHNGHEYQGSFSLNPTTHTLNCSLQIENFNDKEFTITVGTSVEKEEVLLKSIVPKNTLSQEKALEKLKKNQPSLINSYYENGKFTAEIYQRIVVKDQKSYWYIGFASGNGNLKALLLDGFTGEVLAIREVF